MNEQELIAEGYVLTPQVVHTGMGDGKLYEKVVTTIDGNTQVDVRTHKVVNPDGTVTDFVNGAGVVATPEVPTASPASSDETPTTAEVPVPEVPAEPTPEVPQE